jgi:4'-phosphopantetheinyl transferase EntD
MPLEKIETTENRAWALWKLEEDESDLTGQLMPYHTLSDTITNSQKRLESLAGRLLVKELLKSWALSFQGITKDGFGKPFPVGYDFELSLSHSYPYVAALIDKHKPVGIDLEQPKTKLLKIASRILDAGEINDAGDDVVKHCIYWCAKETLIKVHGRKDLFFIKNLKISPFERSEKGSIIGRIIVNSMESTIPLCYTVMDNFVLVFSE